MPGAKTNQGAGASQRVLPRSKRLTARELSLRPRTSIFCVASWVSSLRSRRAIAAKSRAGESATAWIQPAFGSQQKLWTAASVASERTQTTPVSCRTWTGKPRRKPWSLGLESG